MVMSPLRLARERASWMLEAGVEVLGRFYGGISGCLWVAHRVGYGT
jgi:hypothetical protein